MTKQVRQFNLNPFPKGFLLGQTRGEFTPKGFETTELGGSWFLHHDLDVEFVTRTNPHFTITIIGVAYSKVLGLPTVESVLDALERALTFGVKLDAFTDVVLHLSGRFIVFVTGPDCLMLAGDPLGSIPTWWASRENFAVSNYSKLLADRFSSQKSNQKREFFNHPAYKSNQPWLSNIVPEHDVCLPVLPNHVLAFDGGEIEHERFYPQSPLQRLTTEAAVEIVHEEFRFAVARLAERRPLAFSITAGDDAFAFVNVTTDILRSANAIGVTYVFINGEANPTHDDLIGANKRMLAAGLPHQVVPMEFSWGSDFARTYTETHPTMAIFPTLANSIYESGVGDRYFLTGHGGEIGNVFYKERVKRFPSAADLAEKNGTRAFAESELGKSSIAEFIEYAQFTEDRFFNYDPYDLFYWENRLGRWGARMMGEWDFGSRPVSPFSSRRLLDAMMAVPFEDRVERRIYAMMRDKYGQIPL